MTPEDVQEQAETEALARALRETSRKAVTARMEPSNPLHDPVLVALAKKALGEAKGPVMTGAEPFPAVVWKHGAMHTGQKKKNLPFEDSPGIQFTGSLNTFVAVLRQRSEIVAEKKFGWVVEPTINPTGVRTNDATLAMTAMFLDADGNGPWDDALAALSKIGLAHAAYQSGGHKPKTPKWRIVLPLTAPFPVDNENRRVAWKRMYHRVRALVGALGGLREGGFDPTTDMPSVPFFLCERRAKEDPPREVLLHLGSSLDLTALALALPVIEEEDVPIKRTDLDRDALVIASERMEEDRFDAIVSALSAAAKSVPKGRHDLYLAIAGTLLDRHVHPDDVLGIVTEVSASYPRRHADLHADNIHGAKTTIRKYLAGDMDYTRIGKVQGSFPGIAAALDKLVPNETDLAIAKAVSAGVAEAQAAQDPTNIEAPGTPPNKPKIEKKSTALLKKRLAALAEEKIEADDPKKKNKGLLLRHMLADGKIDSFLDPKVRGDVIKSIFGLIGFDVEGVTFHEIAEILGPFSTETYNAGAAEFAKARTDRERYDSPENQQKILEKKMLKRAVEMADASREYEELVRASRR